MLNNLYAIDKKHQELKEVLINLEETSSKLYSEICSGKLEEDECEKVTNLLYDVQEKTEHIKTSVKYNRIKHTGALKKAVKSYTEENIKELILYLIKDDNKKSDIDMDTIELIIRQAHNIAFDKIKFIDVDDNIEFMKKASKWCYSRKLRCEKKNQNVYINKESLIYYIYTEISSINYYHEEIKRNHQWLCKSEDAYDKREITETIESFGKSREEEFKKLKLNLSILRDVYNINL